MRFERFLKALSLAAIGSLAVGCAQPMPPTVVPGPPAPLEAERPPLLQVADDLYVSGSLADAASAYRAFLDDDPDQYGDHALFRLAMVTVQLGDGSGLTAESRRLLEQLVANHPESPYRGPAETVLALGREVTRLRGQIEALKRIDLKGGAG